MSRVLGPLLAVAAFVAALALLEVAARVGFEPPRYHNEPLQLDPELGFRGIPDYRSRNDDEQGAAFGFVLNAEGFRGPLLPTAGKDAKREDDPQSIAVFGDSFLVGAGVPEEALLTTRVGDVLRARGIDSRVYNLSAADYGTGQQLLLLRRVAARLAPDVVVLAMYPGNDVVNNYEGLAGRTLVSPGDYVRPYIVPGEAGLEIRYTHPVRALLRRHSRLYAVLERRALTAAAVRGIEWLQPWSLPTPPEQRIAEGRAPHESLELYRSHAAGEPWERAWQRTFRLLEAFRDECAAHGARLVVLVIPDLHQVRRTGRDVGLDLQLRATNRTPLDRWIDWNLPERRLAEVLREQGIESVLLLPALRQAVRDGADVYLRDRHLNPTGHRIAARHLAAAIAGDAVAGETLEGAPVRLPRGRRAPPLIEPGRADHWRFLDESWVRWAPTREADVAGALALPGAVVAVPGRGRELVVRGLSVARDRSRELEIGFVAGPRQGFRIDEPGPFVLRVAVPPRLPRSDGYVAVRFGPADPAEGEGAAGLILREVGFASP